MCINVVNASILLIGHGDCARFTRTNRLIFWHAGLTGWPRWACVIRVTWWSRLSRLARSGGPRLPGLARRALLALPTLILGECRIHVAVDVPRFVIVVTAIAVAISRIVHVIHFQ